MSLSGLEKIKNTPIRQLVCSKIPNYLYKQKTNLLWYLFGKVPQLQSWRGQWYAYDIIKRRYLGATYNLSTLYPSVNPCEDKKNIWIYWNSGMENAPDLVKKCYSQLVKNIPIDYRLHVITESNISEYMILPDFIKKKLSRGIMAQAHFSDILRTALLYKYGGIWMDATCLLSQPLPDKVLKSDLFMFQANKMTLVETYPPIKCSNWFIAANETENYLLSRVLQVVLNYWIFNNRLIHYYLYHLTLSALVDVDYRCKDIWDNIPYVCNMNPHVMWFEFFKEYTPTRWNNAIESCFVHKLSYKFDSSELNREKQNLLMYFINSYENDKE